MKTDISLLSADLLTVLKYFVFRVAKKRSIYDVYGKDGLVNGGESGSGTFGGFPRGYSFTFRNPEDIFKSFFETDMFHGFFRGSMFPGKYLCMYVAIINTIGLLLSW